MSSDVPAVVVLYHPDRLALQALESICAAHRHVYVVDNTPGDSNFHLPSGCRLLHSGENRGVAWAYDLAAETVVREGRGDWLVTYDQDSLVDPRLPEKLTVLASDWGRASGQLPGVVGPSFTNLRGGVETVVLEPREVDHVISSGCLVLLSAWQKIGGFREDFFVDLVDVEYCRRLRRHGYAILQTPEVLMKHGMGMPQRRSVLGLSRTTSNYGPVRHYYMSRNLTMMLADQWSSAEGLLGRRCRFMVLSIVFEPDRLAKIRAVGWGIVDGLRRRGGICRRSFSA